MSLRLQARSFGWSGQFNGVDTAVGLGSPAGLQRTGAQTWACWFSTPHPQTTTLMARSSGNTATTVGFRLSMTAGKAAVTVADGVSVLTSVVSPLLYADRQWHHMAGVYTGTALLLYIDGLVVASTTTAVPAALASATLPLALGARGDGTTSYFVGWLDDCQIYNRALTAAELANLYTLGVYARPWPDAALQSWWPFNDGVGSAVTDIVGAVNGTWAGTLGSQWSTFVPAMERGTTPPPPPPPPPTPTITVSPTSGVVGTLLTVNGSGFTVGQLVTVTFTPLSGTIATGTASASGDGAFTLTLTVPGDAATSVAVITATDAAADSASTLFTVTASGAVTAVFPTVNTTTSGSYNGTQGQVFTLFNPIGQNDSDATDQLTGTGGPNTRWAAKLQWCDYVKTTQYPNGIVVWYPWGNSRVPSGPRIPYGALVYYEKPTHGGGATQAQAAADFANVGTGTPPTVTGGVATLGNWRYVNLPKLLAAAPWASNIGGFGGGILDYVKTAGGHSPRYIYCPGENGMPGQASTNSPAYQQKSAAGTINNTNKGDNPVILRIDATADLKTAAAYTSINLPQLMYNTYHASAGAAPSSVYGSGGDISDYVDNLGGHFGGGGHKGGAVANGHIYFCPVLNQAGKVGGLSQTLISVDVTDPANFTLGTKWSWLDFRNKPAGAGTFSATFLGKFGGFQGIVVCQAQGGVAGKDVVYFVASSLPYMYQLDTSVGPSSKTDNTGKLNVAANPAAWKFANTEDIWADVDTTTPGAYLNGGAVTAYDPDGTPFDAIIFCPFAPHGGAVPNNWILLYDTRKDFADTTRATGAWRRIKTTSVAINDANMATYTDPVNSGYQACVQDNSGYVWIMPTWNEFSTPPASGHQSAWLCWNPLYDFEDAGSWKTYPSYAPTHFDTPQLTVPIWNCGMAFDYDVNALFPAVYGGGYPGVESTFPDLHGTHGYGTGGLAVQMMPDVMANGPGVPPH